MNKEKLSVVIPTFNRKSYLEKIITQVLKQDVADVEISIVVVVDGSTDGTVEMLESNFPDVHIVRGDGDWWYTKSMNEGFKKAAQLNPDFVLTLNDDIEIKANYLSSLRDAYQSVESGSVMGSLSVSIEKPYLVTCSGNIETSKFWGRTRHLIPFLSVVDPSELKGIHKSLTLPGRGMFIPIDTLRQLNNFEERLIQYHSDTDFCLRAKKQGHQVYVSYDACVFSHVELTSASSSFKKQGLIPFLKSFSNKYSRNYIPSRCLVIWRHQTKVCMPLVMMIGIIVNLRNFYRNNKL